MGTGNCLQETALPSGKQGQFGCWECQDVIDIFRTPSPNTETGIIHTGKSDIHKAAILFTNDYTKTNALTETGLQLAIPLPFSNHDHILPLHTATLRGYPARNLTTGASTWPGPPPVT